jgi:hypothetical protein
MDLEDFLRSLPQPYLSPALESKASPISGVGQFTVRDIEPFEILAIEFGPIVDRRTVEIVQDRLGYSLDTCVDWGRYSLQGALGHGGERGIVNHSCNPNTGFLENGIYIAIKPIARGEEVCIDYGTFETWRGWKMACNCRTNDCRGTITSRDYLLPDLQKRLGRWFAPYLRRSLSEAV